VQFLLEIIGAIIEAFLFDKTVNTRKIDKNIEKLKHYNWFNTLYDNHKYHRLFFVNRNVRKYLQSERRVRRLIKSSKAKQRFKNLLEKEGLHSIQE
jgi:hypothetical protein